MLRWLVPLAALTTAANPVVAQSEVALREFFEGRTVSVKQPIGPSTIPSMPGDSRLRDRDQGRRLYGTMGDETSTSVNSGQTPKTKRGRP